MIARELLAERVARVLPGMIALRHDLHQHPELSGQEERTALTVSALLTRHGISHETNVGGTHGIVATITGDLAGGETIALRGDMDALPISEENDVLYKSLVPGRMHACGHDGHTANLVGAALVLQGLRDHLAGQVKLIFQPAEETVSGAKALVAAGVLGGVDRIFMLHGWPDLPPGTIGVRSGPAMASSDSFRLTVRGKGGHGAYPHNTVDPIYTGVQIVNALQSVVSREISPTAPAVISVTQFHAGTALNIIPPHAEIGGTVRTLDTALRTGMHERIERIIAGVCAAHRADYTLSYHYGTPITVNDAAAADYIRSVGRELLGDDCVVELTEPTMGAEDFAYYLQHVPGAMLRLGVGCAFGLHHPKYDFGDTPLETGITLFAGLALSGRQ